MGGVIHHGVDVAAIRDNNLFVATVGQGCRTARGDGQDNERGLGFIVNAVAVCVINPNCLERNIRRDLGIKIERIAVCVYPLDKQEACLGGVLGTGCGIVRFNSLRAHAITAVRIEGDGIQRLRGVHRRVGHVFGYLQLGGIGLVARILRIPALESTDRCAQNDSFGNLGRGQDRAVVDVFLNLGYVISLGVLKIPGHRVCIPLQSPGIAIAGGLCMGVLVRGCATGDNISFIRGTALTDTRTVVIVRMLTANAPQAARAAFVIARHIASICMRMLDIAANRIGRSLHLPMGARGDRARGHSFVPLARNGIAHRVIRCNRRCFIIRRMRVDHAKGQHTYNHKSRKER